MTYYHRCVSVTYYHRCVSVTYILVICTFKAEYSNFRIICQVKIIENMCEHVMIQ